MPDFTALTKRPTPLFNHPEFPKLLAAPEFREGHWRVLETLLLPKTPVRVQHIFNNGICQIASPAYPHKTPLYTHITCLGRSLSSQKKWTRPPLPPLDVFLNRVAFCLQRKTPYLLGGNSPLGARTFCNLYFEEDQLEAQEKQIRKLWMFKGVDCSGLIYWATKGAVGRNTSDLLEEGAPVAIEDLLPDQLIEKLKPGMLIVWLGHVLLISNEGIIDSTPEKDVSFSPLRDTIYDLLNLRLPLNAWPKKKNTHLSFVVRDLYSNKRNRAS